MKHARKTWPTSTGQHQFGALRIVHRKKNWNLGFDLLRNNFGQIPPSNQTNYLPSSREQGRPTRYSSVHSSFKSSTSVSFSEKLEGEDSPKLENSLQSPLGTGPSCPEAQSKGSLWLSMSSAREEKS